jgi:hypothetical protein
VSLVRDVPRFTLQTFHPRSAASIELRQLAPIPLADLEKLRTVFEPVVGKFSLR